MNEDDQETYYRNERDANDALELIGQQPSHQPLHLIDSARSILISLLFETEHLQHWAF
jgi:hypothetical protein